jgi:hypothetical protein
MSILRVKYFHQTLLNREIEDELTRQRRHRLMVEQQVEKLSKENPQALGDKTSFLLRRIGKLLLHAILHRYYYRTH